MTEEVKALRDEIAELRKQIAELRVQLGGRTNYYIWPEGSRPTISMSGG